MERPYYTLEAARQYEREQMTAIPQQERPLFHLTPAVGWMNDPNGFCCDNGTWHLFYQYYPYDRVWGPMHWGHAASTDLLHWQHLPAALAPDTDADCKGCFSGSALPLENGRMMMMYTGVATDKTGTESQTQCIAVGSGNEFCKDAANPVIGAADLPEGFSTRDFRDPKIWQQDGRFYCVAVGRHATRQGSVLLYESKDAAHWNCLGVPAASDGKWGEMWECPDLFLLEDRPVLLLSTIDMQPEVIGEFRQGRNTLAMLGKPAVSPLNFTLQQAQTLDQGLEFYAPQTTLAPDGRRILIGWMENWDTVDSEERTDAWFSRMSLPRELTLKDGRLCQQPVRELEQLHRNTVQYTGLELDGERTLPGVEGQRLDLTVTLQLPTETACRGFRLQFAADKLHHTELCYTPHTGELVLDRSHSGSKRAGAHRCSLITGPRNDLLELRLILDKGSVEVFVNGGERVMSAVLPAFEQANGITFAAEGPLTLDVTAHQLA